MFKQKKLLVALVLFLAVFNSNTMCSDVVFNNPKESILSVFEIKDESKLLLSDEKACKVGCAAFFSIGTREYNNCIYCCMNPCNNGSIKNATCSNTSS